MRDSNNEPSKEPNNEQIVQACENWLKQVVIKYNFCPFARKEFDAQTIAYTICEHKKIESVLTAIQNACEQLDNNKQISTTLVILPHGFERFDRYLDLVDAAQSKIIDPQYEGIYQLASFHPDYCFADAHSEDPANYTNRSPYAMVHIIGELQLEQALAQYQDPESIPDKNVTLARRKGLTHMQAMLAQCYPNELTHTLNEKK